MADTKDGGSVYPQKKVSHGMGRPVIYMTSGMTVRDYFAGQALGGMLAANIAQRLEAAGLADRMVPVISTAAYLYADAMLAERDKK